ncbi:hypothetical protein L6452_37011 [Arctium lappa]|uniref:Uncharacterized protein n=1 Tax=Arctium lappa TaxID=4217 RepID=A0ACB8Y3C7_ARCLA|nr:hypothetical protein L6452_37011 [Arctium lappa]
MVVAATYAEAAITNCAQVLEKVIKPCLDYLTKGGSVSTVCCNAVRVLNDDTKSPMDRELACNCFKVAFAVYDGINPDNALGLPGKCSVKFPYRINSKTDCSK